jgi:hypothetical protein
MKISKTGVCNGISTPWWIGSCFEEVTRLLGTTFLCRTQTVKDYVPDQIEGVLDDLAFVLAQYLHGVTKMIEQGPRGTTEALAGLDRAIDCLMPHTRFADTCIPV